MLEKVVIPPNYEKSSLVNYIFNKQNLLSLISHSPCGYLLPRKLVYCFVFINFKTIECLHTTCPRPYWFVLQVTCIAFQYIVIIYMTCISMLGNIVKYLFVIKYLAGLKIIISFTFFYSDLYTISYYNSSIIYDNETDTL